MRSNEVGRLLFVLGMKLDDAVGRGKRPWTEGERVNGTEHRGVQPNAEREDEDGRDGEARRFREHAKGESNVGEHNNNGERVVEAPRETRLVEE